MNEVLVIYTYFIFKKGSTLVYPELWPEGSRLTSQNRQPKTENPKPITTNHQPPTTNTSTPTALALLNK